MLSSLEQLADFPFHLSCGAVEGQPRLMLHVGGSDSPPLQPAIARAFADHRTWAATHATPCVGALNKLLPFGRTQLDYMLAAEFRQEQVQTVALSLCFHAGFSPPLLTPLRRSLLKSRPWCPLAPPATACASSPSLALQAAARQRFRTNCARI